MTNNSSTECLNTYENQQIQLPAWFSVEAWFFWTPGDQNAQVVNAHSKDKIYIYIGSYSLIL